MRYLLFVCVVLYGMSFTLTGCQKEDLGNLDAIFADTAQAGPVPKMTAKINGVAWSASTYDITIEPGNPGLILITGTSDDGQTVSFTIKASHAGDYLLGKTSASVGTYEPDTLGTTYYQTNATLATGGVINIDYIDSQKFDLSGEFNFIAATAGAGAKTVTVTNGIITDLDYSSPSVNTKFSAKYNGNLWNPKDVNTALSNVNGISTLTISAINEDGTKMTLSMPADVPVRKVAYKLTQTGSYTATYVEKGFTLVPDESSPYNMPKMACDLKITANDTKTRTITGNFDFYAVDSHNMGQRGSRITGGVFNITY